MFTEVIDGVSLISFEESLVLVFEHDDAKHSVKILLVVDEYGFSLKKSDIPSRKFQELIFLGVTNYRRECGSKIFKDKLSYQSDKYQGSICVYDIENQDLVSSKEFSASFSSFGDIRFRYNSVIGRGIICEVFEENSSFLYRDIDTGQIIDFFNPFN